jgi:hypothetical protein
MRDMSSEYVEEDRVDAENPEAAEMRSREGQKML